MEVLLSLAIGLIAGFVVGKIAGYGEVLAALQLQDCEVKLAKIRREKERVDRKIQRLERKTLKYHKEDVNPQ